MRKAAGVAWGVAAAIALAGCASNVSGTAAVGSPVSTATSRSDVTTSTSESDDTRTTVTEASKFASGVTLDEFDQDLEDAPTIVDQWWSTHWSDFYTGRYTSPRVVGLYDGSDPDTAPTCGGEPLEQYNAFYCRPEDYVAWDVSLMADGTDLIGDTWIYLVIAHEWGHAIQNRLDLTLVSDGRELQADCLGAAVLFGAVADGTLQLEDGDEKEMVNSLSLLADETAWTSSADHGDPFERVQWFNLGRSGGVLACHTAQSSEELTPTDSSGPVVTGTSTPTETALPESTDVSTTPPTDTSTTETTAATTG